MIEELRQKREQLDKQIKALESIGGAYRPIDDETLQLLGLIAADAARQGRIVPQVPLLCDHGETARVFMTRAALQPGDKLVAVPPFPGKWELLANGGKDLEQYLRCWSDDVSGNGFVIRAKGGSKK